MPINIRSINGISVANDGTATIGGGATYAQAAAASAAEAALYDGKKVDDNAELEALTPALIGTGLVRQIDTGAVFRGVTSGEDRTTAGELKLRALEREFKLTSEMFDFDPSGISDNSSKMMKVLERIAANGGGTFLLGRGNFRLNSTISGIPDNTTIAGMGRGVSRFVSGGSSLLMFEQPNTDDLINFTVQDLGFIGDGGFTLGASQAIRARGFDGVYVRRCHFEDWQVAAVILGLPASGATYGKAALEDNVIDGGGDAVPFSGFHIYNCDGVLVARNRAHRVARPFDFEQNDDPGIGVGSFARNVDVIRNYWSECRLSDHSPTNTYYGVHFATDASSDQGFEKIRIAYNVAENNVHDDGSGGESSINGRDIEVADFAGDTGTGVEVVGNISRGFEANASGTRAAINVQRCPGAKIVENTGYAPVLTGTTFIRDRDNLDAEVHSNRAIDGSVAWSRCVSEFRIDVSAPILGRKYANTGGANVTRLSSFAEAVVEASGDFRRIVGGGISTSETTALSPVAASTDITITAGVLTVGSKIRLNMGGEFVGTAGAKTLGVLFNSSTATRSAVAAADMVNGDAFTYDLEMHVVSNTEIAFYGTLAWGGKNPTIPADLKVRRYSGAHTGLNLTTTNYSLLLAAWVGNAADAIRIRSFEISGSRFEG
jgi:hypothetical protein